MRTQRNRIAIVLGCFGVITVFAQGQPADPKRTPGVQAGQDPNRDAFVAANCKNPPAPPAAPAGGGRGRGPAGAAGAQTAQQYTVTEIPGVIAAGQRWTILW